MTTDTDLTEADIELLAAETTRRAAADQEAAEWAYEAQKIASFWTVLREAGIGKQLAGVLTIQAQSHAYEEEADSADDDDDD